MPERRTKMSAPPSATPSAGDRTVLAGLVHSSAYPLILDVIQTFAIAQEIEVYVNPVVDSNNTLERIYMARAAWLVLDQVQHRVDQAIEMQAEIKARAADQSDDGVRSAEEILGVD